MWQQLASTKLVIPDDKVNRIFVDGGFSKNSLFMNMLARAFPEKEIYGAAIAQSTRLVLRPRGGHRMSPRPLPSAQRAQQELDACNGDVTRTAAQLSISRDQLNRLIRREGLRVVRVRSGAGAKPPRSEEASADAPEEAAAGDAAAGEGARDATEQGDARRAP